MRKWLAETGVALVLSLVSTASSALPCAGFTDVDDTSPFCANVTWLKNRGITLGCTSATLYCPNDFVSRLQMAAFMNRLGDSLFPLTCAAGQVMKWDGLQWACANDAIGGGGGGGTVTSVAAGTGLQGSPNPITGAGSINLAPGYQLPQACSNGQVPKSNGAGGWACGADNAARHRHRDQRHRHRRRRIGHDTRWRHQHLRLGGHCVRRVCRLPCWLTAPSPMPRLRRAPLPPTVWWRVSNCQVASTGRCLRRSGGLWICGSLPPTITTMDSGGFVGTYTAIAIGADGFPVVSYYDFTNGNLKVAKCINAACSGGADDHRCG